MPVQSQNSSQKVTVFLWFNNNIQEALNFYTSIFSDSKIISIYHKGAKSGPIHSAIFEINNLRIIAFNGKNPKNKSNEETSLMVSCETQEEIDDKWERLSTGGEESRCGWLKDKFGISWQVVPSVLGDLLEEKEEEKSKRVMDKMLKMRKLDILALKEAYAF